MAFQVGRLARWMLNREPDDKHESLLTRVKLNKSVLMEASATRYRNDDRPEERRDDSVCGRTGELMNNMPDAETDDALLGARAVR